MYPVKLEDLFFLVLGMYLASLCCVWLVERWKLESKFVSALGLIMLIVAVSMAWGDKSVIDAPSFSALLFAAGVSVLFVGLEEWVKHPSLASSFFLYGNSMVLVITTMVATVVGGVLPEFVSGLSPWWIVVLVVVMQFLSRKSDNPHRKLHVRIFAACVCLQGILSYMWMNENESVTVFATSIYLLHLILIYAVIVLGSWIFNARD